MMVRPAQDVDCTLPILTSTFLFSQSFLLIFHCPVLHLVNGIHPHLSHVRPTRDVSSPRNIYSAGVLSFESTLRRSRWSRFARTLGY